MATVLVFLFTLGCHALGLVGQVRPDTGRSGLTVPGSTPPIPGVLASAGDSIFKVVAWSFAVIAGALALAFIAKLLNGRNAARPPSRALPSEPDRILSGHTP